MILEGIFTHFATADEADDSYYNGNFLVSSIFGSLKSTPPYIHAANSAAALYHKDSTFNAVRIGIAMYGLSPSNDVSQFPVYMEEMFSLQTKIIHVKKLSAGESVGYGANIHRIRMNGLLPSDWLCRWMGSKAKWPRCFSRR